MQPKVSPSTPPKVSPSTPPGANVTPVVPPGRPPGGPPITQSPPPSLSPPVKQSLIITRDKWVVLDERARTNMLKDAADRYMRFGHIISQAKDVNVMTDSWTCIKGKSKRIPIKDVKDRMSRGDHILDLIKFLLTKVPTVKSKTPTKLCKF